MKFSVLAKWFCAVADAWNRGEAPWVYDERGRSETVKMWNKFKGEGWQADERTVSWIRAQGITLKKDRPA